MSRSSLSRGRALAAALAATFVLVAIADPADAQRRRRAADADTAPQRATSGHDFGPEDPWGLSDEPVLGPVDARVTIVEFSDFECPFCTRVKPTLAALMADPAFAPDIRLVFLHMPLPFHQAARPLANAALEAHRHGRFWDFHDLAFAGLADLGRPPAIAELAAELGLDPAAFVEAAESDLYGDRIDEHGALAARIGVRGTPSFMINGRLVAGAQPLGEFVRVIQEERDAMQALLDRGVPFGQAYEQRVRDNLADAERARNAAEPESYDLQQRVYVATEGAASRGAEDAPVVIVEFGDFECPFCRRAAETITTLLGEYDGRIRFVWRHNPLDFHADARPAARGAIAAGEQGMFWEYHDRLFAQPNALSEADLERHATELGLDLPRWRAAFDDPATAARVDADIQAALDVWARGTPQFFVNGRRLMGAQPIAEFRAVIDDALAEADALIEAGTAPADVYETVLADAPRRLEPQN